MRAVGFGFLLSSGEMGSHYEWEGDTQVWYDDKTWDFHVDLLLWRFELFYVRVRPTRRFSG